MGERLSGCGLSSLEGAVGACLNFGLQDVAGIILAVENESGFNEVYGFYLYAGVLIMLIFPLFVLVITGLCDLTIGMRYFRKRCSPVRWKRIVFWVQAVLFDLVLPVLLLILTRFYEWHEMKTQVLLWMMWVLTATLFPKLLFTVFLGLNRLVGLISRTKTRFLEITGGTLAVLAVVVLIYGAFVGVSRVRVNRVEIVSEKIPASFDGYKIAHFSDLHIGNISRKNPLIQTVIDSIRGVRPDLIISTGDLINLSADEVTPKIFEQMQQLKAPDGVVSVLGNHDLGRYIPDREEGMASLSRLKEIQRDLGWNLLINEYIWLRRGEDSLPVAGVGFPDYQMRIVPPIPEEACDLARTMRGIDPDSVFTLLASHTPTVWDSIPAVAKPDLTLSGHIHAMQVKLKAGKFQFSPIQWVYPEWSGLYERDKRRLYVNDGVGYVFFPIRIGSPGEVTLYTLKSSK